MGIFNTITSLVILQVLRRKGSHQLLSHLCLFSVIYIHVTLAFPLQSIKIHWVCMISPLAHCYVQLGTQSTVSDSSYQGLSFKQGSWPTLETNTRGTGKLSSKNSRLRGCGVNERLFLFTTKYTLCLLLRTKNSQSSLCEAWGFL